MIAPISRSLRMAVRLFGSGADPPPGETPRAGSLGPAHLRHGYRPEIDGLRAVAVWLVIGYHCTLTAGGSRLPGGAIGVDVFFVISGFLITQMLARDLRASGRVDLWKFYARRALRILPAALAVLLLVPPAMLGAGVLDRSIFREDLPAAALGWHNWHLVHEGADYWAVARGIDPLPHFWSLSVEEQFYLAWPTLLAALWAVALRMGLPPLRTLAAAVGALSGIARLTWLLVPLDPPLAYFGTFTRSGELGLGAFAGILTLDARPHPGLRARWMGSLAVLGGAVALLLLARASPEDAFPAFGTAAAVATAAMLTTFAVVPTAPLTAPLRWALPAYSGRISYGLYLWHLPVDELMRATVGGRLPLLARLGMTAALTTGLAAASFHWIELPARSGAVLARLGGRRVVLAGVGALLLVAAIGTTLVSASLSGARGVLPARLLVAAANDRPQIDCPVRAGEHGRLCLRRPAAGRPSLVVIGDSHARMWDPAWQHYAGRRALAYYSVLLPGCRIAPALENATDSPACARRRAELIADAASAGPALVVVAIRMEVSGRGDWRRDLQRLLRPFAEAGAPVVVLGPIPEFPEDVPRCLARAAATAACSTGVSRSAPRERLRAELRRTVAAVPGAGYVDLDELVCPGGVCPAVSGGRVTRRDRHHLTQAYAGVLASRLEAALVQAQAAAARGGAGAR